MMKRVLVLFGTRPEAIKLAPVIGALRSRFPEARTIVCSTGQHREMLRQVLELFKLPCDHELDIMQPNQSLSGLTARLFEALDRVIGETKPDWVLVQGDTTTAFVGATVAFYHRCRVGHVEAGLRSADNNRPFPEEVNRRFIDVVADAYFAPTAKARECLLRESARPDSVLMTGNTVVDAVRQVSAMPYAWESGPLKSIARDRPIVSITAHRRESFGEPFREICAAIRELACRYEARGIQFVYPVHLNPNVRGVVFETLSGCRNVKLIEPLDYQSMIQLLSHSLIALTDSGGIQEEAPGLSVPVFVMREVTERPEGVEAGVAKLVGTSAKSIVEGVTHVLDHEDARVAMMRSADLYGDGRAAERIVGYLQRQA